MNGIHGGGEGGGEREQENSQAEAALEGAVGPVVLPAAGNQEVFAGANGNRAHNPHYENIYESIGGGANHASGAAAAAVAASNNNHSNKNGNWNNNSMHRMANHNTTQSLNRTRESHQRQNEMYGYDVIPVRNRTTSGGGGLVGGTGIMPRRANLHLDLNMGGGGGGGGLLHSNQQMPIYAPQAMYSRQHSFDDTESAHYHQVLAATSNNSNNYLRYENLYEQIHEEPIYRNVPTAASGGGKVYGRLDVIGHGIGRIERHLSSSCGNIDHYNLGGHYAVMGHSHLGAVGHIRFNANQVAGGAGRAATATEPGGAAAGALLGGTAGRGMGKSGGGLVGGASGGGGAVLEGAAKETKEGNVKSSYSYSFFNCLSKENSQSMMNMERMVASGGSSEAAVHQQQPTCESPGIVMQSASASLSSSSSSPSQPPAATTATHNGESKLISGRQTGAIPKVNNGSVGGSAGSGGGGGGSAAGTTSRPKASKQQPAAQQLENGAAAGEANRDSSMSLNKITKSSMQWLLMNKWLPLWIQGQGSDCRVIDFNFMFSRKCDGCGDDCRHEGCDEELLRLAGEAGGVGGATTTAPSDAEDRSTFRNYIHPQFLTPHPTHRPFYGDGPGIHSWHDDGHLSLRREHSLPGGGCGDQRHYDVPRPNYGRFAREQFLSRARLESPNLNGRPTNWSRMAAPGDPFRNWELNVENNTFKPANNRVQDVRRITDGTYRKKEMKEVNSARGPSALAATEANSPVVVGNFGKFQFLSQTSEAEDRDTMAAAGPANRGAGSAGESSGGGVESDREESLKRSSESEDGSVCSSMGGESSVESRERAAVVVAGEGSNSGEDAAAAPASNNDQM